MAQRSHVPKFGNWEDEENVLYTAYFDNARKGRTGGKMINPNDPQENPDLVPEYSAPGSAMTAAPGSAITAAPGSLPSSAVDSQKRSTRRSAQSENSMERSPLHHHAKIMGRGGGAPSPSWEGRGSYQSSHGTPGRFRLRPKGDESPDKSAAVPKFGDWDENNPSSADGYTHIFNKMREEKQTGAAKVPGMPTESSHGNFHKQTPSDSSMSCCFFWGRK